MTDNLRDSALRQAAACAREKYAGEEKRIERGLLLALNNKVALPSWTGSETSLVQSDSDKTVFYNVVRQHCDCPDFGNAPDGRCKHRWAVHFAAIAELSIRMAG